MTMQHAKKMLLVDPERLPQQSTRRMSPLDSEIEKTLKDHMPDDVKAKLYYSILSKYANKATSSDTPISPWQQQHRQQNDEIEDELLQSVPPDIRYKAKRIVRLLRSNRDVEWNGHGQFIYRQQLIPNSNIIDLVSDILSEKTLSSPPIGWEQFADALNDSGVTKDLVPNVKRWKYISQSKIQSPKMSKSVRKSSRKRKKKFVEWEV